MKTLVARFLLVALCCCASFSARGDLLQLLSANRSVDVFALAGHRNGSLTDGRSRTALQYDDFSASVSAAAAWTDPDYTSFRSQASANASQDSSLGGLNFAITQELRYTTGGPMPGGGIVRAVSESFFQVTFTVTETVRFQANLSIIRALPGTADYTETFNLHSASMDLDLSSPLGVSGLLNPGETYTLTASQRFEDNVADPLGQDGLVNSTLKVDFAPVPEPSVVVCSFLGLVSLVGSKALAARRRNKTLGVVRKS